MIYKVWLECGELGDPAKVEHAAVTGDSSSSKITTETLHLDTTKILTVQAGQKNGSWSHRDGRGDAAEHPSSRATHRTLFKKPLLVLIVIMMRGEK